MADVPPGSQDPRRVLHHEVLQAAGASPDLRTVLDHLCRRVLERSTATGVALTLMTPTDTRLGQAVAAATDERARRWQELQLTSGEGPGTAAFETGRTVVVADLEDHLATWPGLVPEARRTGLRAVVSLPLALGASRFGALETYWVTAHRPSADQLRDLIDAADVATAFLLDAVDTLHGSLAEGGDGEEGPRPVFGLLDVVGLRTEVYQAQGMVTTQRGVPLDQALALMRGHAFATGLSLTDVAVGILAGDIHLETEEP